MKIIISGAKEPTKRYFKCTKCGCVYIADENEYERGEQYNETWFYANCPEKGCSGTGHELSKAERDSILNFIKKNPAWEQIK